MKSRVPLVLFLGFLFTGFVSKETKIEELINKAINPDQILIIKKMFYKNENIEIFKNIPVSG